VIKEYLQDIYVKNAWTQKEKKMNKILEKLKSIDWILLAYVGGFTIGSVATFIVDYEMTKNIFFVFGIISAYIFIILFRDKEIREKIAMTNKYRGGE
jgi:hypothetical protein